MIQRSLPSICALVVALSILLPNLALAEIMDRSLQSVGGVEYDAEDLAFARELYQSFPDPDVEIGSEATVEPFAALALTSSTDVGDVSWVVPTAAIGACGMPRR